MIKPKKEMEYVRESQPAGGAGSLEKYLCLHGKECPSHIEFVARVMLKPDSSVGTHRHEGNGEIWYYLSGQGEYTEDGSAKAVSAGDLTICYPGSCHGVRNTGKTDLEYIAVKFTV